MADINLVCVGEYRLFSPISIITAMPVCGSRRSSFGASRSSAHSLSLGSTLAGCQLGKLHEIEREVAFTPGLAPVSDHRRKERAVLLCATRITFA